MIYEKIKPNFDKYHLDCINNPLWVERIMKEKNLSFNFPKQLKAQIKINAYCEWRKKYD